MAKHSCDVLIVGGGPAGMAAASAAAEGNANVILIDENPGLGGQIWRGEEIRPTIPEATRLIEQVHSSKVHFLRRARVFDAPDINSLAVETESGCDEIQYSKLIIATGARERFLPFPGWTLPNVMGAGGLQALVKGGMPIEGKRVVVAGSGPLPLAVAVYLKKRGAQAILVAEQARGEKVFSFGLSLAAHPSKLLQAIMLRMKLVGSGTPSQSGHSWTPYRTDCYPVEAHGESHLRAVTLRDRGKLRKIDCDYLACGFHLTPNSEIASLLGCELTNSAAAVSEFQETSIAGVYAAGEAAGIGGLECAIVEGHIAGYAAAGMTEKSRALFAKRSTNRGFASAMNAAFALRDELKHIVTPDTFVCRCEDVAMGRLEGMESWREAKLSTRCGMGPCQGRICGSALEFLKGWKVDSVRPPVVPVRLGNL